MDSHDSPDGRADVEEAGVPIAHAPTKRAPMHIAMAVGHGILTWILRISLPLLFINALLRAFPYRTTVAGVPFRVQATLFSRRGLTADTTFGNWEFPHVDGLPVGVHVSPVNVDLLRLSRIANPDTGTFVDALKAGFSREAPWIIVWLLGITALGLGLGLALAAAINMSVRYLRGLPRRSNELQLRLRQLAVAGVVVVCVAGYGLWSYHPAWSKQSRLTGTLGAVQLFPSQLEKFYNRQSKVYDVLGAVVGIQAALQARIDQQNTPETAFNIMYISDMHLAAGYPLVQQYVQNFDVKLIVNTGDETEFGSSVELTSAYVASIAKITKTVPMIWLAGNHDSPETVKDMARIKGVTVLGSKSRLPDGTFAVTASQVNAYGLTIAGLPDPRVYGASGAAGSDKDADTDPLERAAVSAATNRVSKDAVFDIFATHEPVAAKELRKKLPGQIRQTNAGHTHEQNKIGDVQGKDGINLVEGSTGAGGLDNINRKVPAPPIEFSIESVAPNCQFTKVVRFQLADPALPADPAVAAGRDDVTVTSFYLASQHVAQERICDVSSAIGSVVPLGG